MKTFIISTVTIAILGIMVFFSWIGKNDREIELREQLTAQDEVCQANFDKMFKVIAQTAQVPSEYMSQSKDAFKEIYRPLIEGRYQNKDGEQQQVLMKWVQESNPAFDMGSAAPLYAKIQTVVEAQRNEFFNQQKKLIDIHRQHTVFCSTFLNANLFFMKDRIIPKCVGEREEGGEYCIQIIKSANTDNTYKTGQENDISLF
jgi:hypothetical protein